MLGDIFEVEVGRRWVPYSPEVNAIINGAYDRGMRTVDVQLPMGKHTVNLERMTQVAKHGRRTLRVRLHPRNSDHPTRLNFTRPRAANQNKATLMRKELGRSPDKGTGSPVTSVQLSKLDRPTPQEPPRKSLFKKAIGSIFNGRGRIKSDEDIVPEEVFELEDLSRMALQYLVRVQEFCDRLRIAPGELYRSHIASLDERRAPCCSRESLCVGLANADSSLHVQDSCILFEIYDAAKSYCLNHKTHCLTRTGFVEAVEFGVASAPRGKARKSGQSPRRKSPDSDAGHFTSSSPSPRMRRKETRDLPVRQRSPERARSPRIRGRRAQSPEVDRYGDRRIGHRGTRTATPSASLPFLKTSNIAPDMPLFVRLGGEKRSANITRNAFVKGIEAESRRLGRRCNADASWRKLDPVDKGVVSYKDFLSTFTYIDLEPKPKELDSKRSITSSTLFKGKSTRKA